jgi:hypothetical protein
MAHVGALPVEEVVPLLTGAALAWMRAWAGLRLRRRR